MWGAYTISEKDEGKEDFVQPYPVSSVVLQNYYSYKAMTYDGRISKSILSSPAQGILLSIEGEVGEAKEKIMAIRAFNRYDFLLHNYGKE